METIKKNDIIGKLCDLECTSITIAEIANVLKRDYFETIPVEPEEKTAFVNSFKTMNEFVNVIWDYSQKVQESSSNLATDCIQFINVKTENSTADITKYGREMSIEDLPGIVNNLLSIKTLTYDILERYFYNIKIKERLGESSDNIKADMEALFALCEKTTDSIIEIANNTEGVVLDD